MAELESLSSESLWSSSDSDGSFDFSAASLSDSLSQSVKSAAADSLSDFETESSAASMSDDDSSESEDFESDDTSPSTSRDYASRNKLFDENPRLKAACSEPLYAGSQISIFMSRFQIFQYAFIYFSQLLDLIAVHLPQEAKVSTTVYSVKKFFSDLFPDMKVSHHPYCSSCHRPLLTLQSTCDSVACAGSPVAKFVTIPLENQLQRMLEGMLTVKQ